LRPSAFRVAIGSLDIFPARQKGGIQLPLFCVDRNWRFGACCGSMQGA
jgi:hypothetical protein